MMRLLDWGRTHLSWHITSLEDIGSILNGPLLLFAAILAGLNQITGGGILRDAAWLGLTWAILQIVGIDLQYTASARRLKDALVLRRWMVALFWAALTLLLAAPVILANLTFTLQMMLGWTDAQAMALISLTPLEIAVGRAILQAILAFVSAVTRETRKPAEATERTERTQPVPAPTAPKPRRTPKRTRSHTGTTAAEQLALREQRLHVIQSMLQEAAAQGERVSVGMVAKRLGLNSNSQASNLLEKARTRYQAG